MDRTMTVGPRRFAVLCVLLPLLTLAPVVAFAHTHPAPEATGWLMVLVLPAILAAGLPVLAYRSVLAGIIALVLVVMTTHPLPAPAAMVALSVTLSSVVASALVTRRLVHSTDQGLQRIRGRSEVDQLTGTLNRRGLERHLLDAFPAGSEVTVGVVDLDHLKHLNDRYGHDAGDRALVLVAAALRAAVPGGLVARIGGDEFLTAVAGPDDGFADRVRRALPQQDRPVTVSIGTATGPVDGTGQQMIDELLRRADVLLYRDKSTARPLPDEPPGRAEAGAPRADGDSTVFGRSTRRFLAVIAAAFAVLTLPAIVFSDELSDFGERIEPAALLICLVLDLLVVFFLLRPGPNRRTVAPALMIAVVSLAVMSLSGTGQFMATAVWVVPLLPAFQVLGPRSRTVLFAGVLAIRLLLVIKAVPLGEEALLISIVQLAVLCTVVGWLALLHVRANRVRETLTELSATDPLTGLLNRGGLERAVAEKGWGTAAVTVLDIDRFKQINDRHGHAVGDQVLLDLATELRRTNSAGALIGRLGGDEFVVVDGSGGVGSGRFRSPVPVTSGSSAGPLTDTPALWSLVRVADAALLQRRRLRPSRQAAEQRSPQEDHS